MDVETPRAGLHSRANVWTPRRGAGATARVYVRYRFGGIAGTSLSRTRPSNRTRTSYRHVAAVVVVVWSHEGTVRRTLGRQRDGAVRALAPYLSSFRLDCNSATPLCLSHQSLSPDPATASTESTHSLLTAVASEEALDVVYYLLASGSFHWLST